MNWHQFAALGLKLLAAIVIVALTAFFVAAEFALVRVRDTQLRPIAARGRRSAAHALHILHHLDAYLSTMQLGITLCSLGMGALVEPLFTELLSPLFDVARVESPEVRRTISIVFGFLVNSYVITAIGELAPKSFALRRAVPVSLAVAIPLRAMHFIFFPYVWVLNWTSQWFLERIGVGDPVRSDQAHSEEELRLLIAAAPGRDLVLNALDLSRRLAREVMQPRPEIVVFDTEASIDDCVAVAEQTRYSRFPLCEGGNLDRMLGVVHIKNLYAQQRHHAQRASELRTSARKLLYVPETARLERVLRFLLERKLHMAIVVDEYGGTVGLLTLENILEEVVGQIQDEFDQEKPLVTRLDEHTWEIAGNLPLHDLSTLVGEPLLHEDIISASGWVTHRLGGFPEPGDTVRVGDALLQVEETQGPRVVRLKLTRTGPVASST